MANNRLFIVCKKCNAFFVLLKYYPPQGFIAGDQGWGDTRRDDKEFNEWVKTHEKHAAEIDYNGGEFFAFVTEQDEKVKLYDFEHNKIILL